MTPSTDDLRTWELARIVENGRVPTPPVPTTNSRMPLAESAVPSGRWGAKRS